MRFKDYADTNYWAMVAAQDVEKTRETRKQAQEKGKTTRKYNSTKSRAIVALEAKITAKLGKCKPYNDRNANGFTRFILDWLEWSGYYGARVNVGGVRLPDGTWRTSGATKGVADVIACINGHFVQFEVKAGKDRTRESQLYQQQLTIAAGGDYFFTHNADEFIQQVETIKTKYENGRRED